MMRIALITQRGVTLIELLIVLTIMMTTLGLVAPLALNSIEKAQAQSEYLGFAAWLKKASNLGFANGQGITVSLDKNTLIANLPSGEKIERKYEYLNFETLEFRFSRNGMPTIELIKLKSRHQSKSLNLIKLLDGSRE